MARVIHPPLPPPDRIYKNGKVSHGPPVKTNYRIKPYYNFNYLQFESTCFFGLFKCWRYVPSIYLTEWYSEFKCGTSPCHTSHDHFLICSFDRDDLIAFARKNPDIHEYLKSVFITKQLFHYEP